MTRATRDSGSQLGSMSLSSQSLVREQTRPVICKLFKPFGFELWLSLGTFGVVGPGLLKIPSFSADADERLQALDRTLRSLHDQITTAIKGVDLSFLDEQLVDPMMRQREQYRQIVHVG